MKDRCPSEGDAEAQPNAEPLSVRTNVLVTAIAAAWPTAELMKDRCRDHGAAADAKCVIRLPHNREISMFF